MPASATISAIMPAAAAIAPDIHSAPHHRGMSHHTLMNLFALVIAETIAFALLEKSLRSKNNEAGWTAAAVMFILVVPFTFKAMLKSGETIAMANLYWIVLSMILGAALSGVVFRQKVTPLQIAGMAIAVGGAGVAYVGTPP